MSFVWQLVKPFSFLTVNERFAWRVWTVCAKKAESLLLGLYIDEEYDVNGLGRWFVFGFQNVKDRLFVVDQLMQLIWPEFDIWCACDEVSLNYKLFALTFGIFIFRLGFLLYLADFFRLRFSLLFDIGGWRFSFGLFGGWLYIFCFYWIEYVASLAFSDIAQNIFLNVGP